MRALPLLAALALAGCLAAPQPEPPGGPAAPEAGGLRVLVLGDTGTGEEGQHLVARAAERVCAARGCDVALILGDNIYEQGVTSADDPQFDAKFERPYANFTIPFYLVLGNHDNSGGPDEGLGTQPRNGDFQVAYAQRADRASDKWRMPARWYDVRLGDVHLFGIDSTPVTWEGLAGPQDPLAREQQAWLRDAVRASDASWRVVMAHHPYVSNGQHGDAGTVEGLAAGKGLKAFYEDAVCGEADLVLAGHEHDLQWLAPVASCGGTEFLVSGAGAKTRPLADPGRHEAYFQQGDTLGFWWLRFTASELHGVAYDADGAVLFERTRPEA